MVHKKNLKEFWSNYNEEDEDVGLKNLTYHRIAGELSFTQKYQWTDKEKIQWTTNYKTKRRWREQGTR